ncbi:poly-gamma-glutamate synthase PgsB [Salisediminibacterium selenitireducens]|uniref:poly-gamma-glutamate synthase PgsB n=1 Tax=Salisediminibacterium selenitireducens TaxID=85683 RepID=UPI0009FFF2F0
MYLTILASLVLILGIRERQSLNRSIDRIPNRILINGIRGKSTVTRLVMGIIKEDGQKVAGKTTGTSPRLFYWDRSYEEPIVRSLQGANISEQKFITRQVAKRRVDAFVTECMAVLPDYQKTFHESFVKPKITVITNIVEDHLDVMGPTLDQVAEAFAATIPENGHLVLTPSPYEDYFRQIAEKRNTAVHIADPDVIDEAYLKTFPYMMFQENAAIGLSVADILGIKRDTALQGMVSAPVDPGAMKVHPLGTATASGAFYNGFAANDASSTITIWNKIQEIHPDAPHQAVIMNCREDRVERTIQFAKDVLPRMQMDTLIVTGRNAGPVLEACQSGSIQVNGLINLEKRPTEDVKDALTELPEGTILFGVGNIHGGGEEIAEAIEDMSRGVGGDLPKRSERDQKPARRLSRPYRVDPAYSSAAYKGDG